MNNEPLISTAAIVSAVGATLALVVAFGLRLDPTQVAAITGFVTVVAPFVVAYFARKKVTPVANPKDDNGSPLAPESDVAEPYEEDATELVADAEETA